MLRPGWLPLPSHDLCEELARAHFFWSPRSRSYTRLRHGTCVTRRRGARRTGFPPMLPRPAQACEQPTYFPIRMRRFIRERSRHAERLKRGSARVRNKTEVTP